MNREQPYWFQRNSNKIAAGVLAVFAFAGVVENVDSVHRVVCGVGLEQKESPANLCAWVDVPAHKLADLITKITNE